MEGRANVKNKKTGLLYVILLLIIAAAFIPLPFYITRPGEAHALNPIVHVNGGDKNDTSTLMLTTIQMGPANIYSYAWASLRDYEEILPKEDVRYEHESEDEFSVRQFHLMDTSQQNAIAVAFKEADKPYSWVYNGIYVLSVFPDMPAEGVLEAGDRITSIDGRSVTSSKQMTDYVQAKKPGSRITVTFTRDKKNYKKTIQLRAFAELGGKSGLGISLADDRTLKSDPKVTLKADEIGGPSAGLMFSLEIYDQLMEEDLAAGLKVAGTGTIASDGTVGRIGGIAQKVVAADRAGAQFFFAPDDKLPAGRTDVKTNYEEAQKAAEEIDTDMVIVPVQTFSDAVDYLQNYSASK
ncbi:SepM family pheromone-processing serine protease [Domibacillus robiginosus]|uniref:SepM family pheromone-processing serine protease n=1 Tax=Domibacillus robiginosus TaxID=1071054 RepID=UPI00067E4A48|nr:SepM family pheromone-processing serine protease [Domibacillus robiginosus]